MTLMRLYQKSFYKHASSRVGVVAPTLPISRFARQTCDAIDGAIRKGLVVAALLCGWSLQANALEFRNDYVNPVKDQLRSFHVGDFVDVDMPRSHGRRGTRRYYIDSPSPSQLRNIGLDYDQDGNTEKKGRLVGYILPNTARTLTIVYRSTDTRESVYATFTVTISGLRWESLSQFQTDYYNVIGSRHHVFQIGVPLEEANSDHYRQSNYTNVTPLIPKYNANPNANIPRVSTGILSNRGERVEFSVDTDVYTLNPPNVSLAPVFPGLRIATYLPAANQWFRFTGAPAEFINSRVFTYEVSVDYYADDHRFDREHPPKAELVERISRVFTVTINRSHSVPEAQTHPTLYPSTFTWSSVLQDYSQYPSVRYTTTLPAAEVVTEIESYNPGYRSKIKYSLRGLQQVNGQPQLADVGTVLPGFSVSQSGRILQGYPRATGVNATFVYGATDDYGVYSSTQFAVTVVDSPEFTAEPAEAWWVINQEVNITLPIAQDGRPPLSYALNSEIDSRYSDTVFKQRFPGLSFDSTTRVLRGRLTPAENAVGVHTFRYGVTDANGYGLHASNIPTLLYHSFRNSDFGGLAFWNVNVAATEPSFAPAVPSTFFLTETQTVDVTFSNATGGLGGQWTYAFNGGNEFYGLTYNPTTRRLIGKVTLPPSAEGYDPVAAAFSGVYSAVDSYGFIARQPIQFLIKPRTSLYYTPPDGEIDATGPDQFPVEVYGNTVPGYGSPVDTPPFHDQLPYIFGDGPSGSSAARSGWGPYTYTLYSDNVFEFVQTGKKPYRTTQNYQLNNPCNPTCPLPVLPYPSGFNVPTDWVDEPGWIGISNNSSNDSFGAGYYNEPYGKQPQMLALQYYTFSLTATDSNGVESVPLPILLEIWPRLSFPSETAAELTLPWANEFPNHLFFPRNLSYGYDLPGSVGGLHYYAAGGDTSITRFTERTYAMRDIDGAQSLPGGFVYEGGIRLARPASGATGQIYTFVIQGRDRIDQIAFHTFTASANGDPVLHSIGDLTYTAGVPVSTLLSIEPGTGTPPFTAAAIAGSALPLGLTFDVSEFGKVRIKGVPAEDSVGDHPTVVQVTDYFNYSDSLLHRITVVPAPIFIEAPADLTYVQNVPIANLTLSAIDEDTGYGAITYQLLDDSGAAFADDATVAGLSYDRTMRELSGTPTQVYVGGVLLTYIATDANGATVRKDFRVFVFDRAVFEAVQDDITYTVGAQKTVTLPSVISTPPFSYTLQHLLAGSLQALPEALTFDVDVRELIGDFDAATVLTLRYEVTSGASTAVSATFLAVAVPPPSFAPQANLSYTAGHAVTPITFSAADGALPLTYSFDPGNGLADGLTFSLDEPLMLSGAPTIETAETTYSVTATDANEVAGAVSFTLQVFPELTFPDDKLDAYTFVVAQPETITLTEADGGRPAVSYTLTYNAGGLPAALSFDLDARTLTASFDALATFALTYTAIDANNVRESFVITIRSINELLFSPPTIAVTYSVGNLTYSIDGAHYTDDLTLAAAVGGDGAITYANDDAPAGLTAAAVGDELHISGAPTAIGDYTVQRTAVDAAGQQATFTLTIHVASAPRFTANVAAQTYARNFRIAELTLPTVTDGAAPIVYELQDSSGNDFANGAVIAGLNFDANNRIVRGTPTAAVGDYPLTLQGIDVTTAGDSLAFTITIVDALTFSLAQNDLTFSVGRPINLDLAAANGGVGALTYSIALQNAADSALDGVTVTTLNDTPTLSATTPTAVYAATPYILTAHDTSDNTAAATFTITVVDAPSFSGTQDELTFTVSGDIGAINLPTASGGALPLTYTLDNNLPAGVLLNADDSILTGIPTVSQATVNYVLTATDVNGASGSLPAFGIRVYPAPSFAASGFGPFTFTANAPQKSFTLPQVVDGTGAPVVAYNFGALDLFNNGGDAGVNINDFVTLGANTRTVAGSFAAALQFRAQLTATDSNNVTDTSPYATFVVVNEVTFSQSDLDNIADQTYRVGANVNRFLPQVTGGIAPIVYTLSDADGDAYGNNNNNNIAGVTFTASTRAFAGTVASSATGDYTFTYAGVDANDGEATTPMRINIVDALALPQPNDVIYYASMSGIDTALPQATNTIGVITYELQNLSDNGLTLPSGIIFNANANPPSLTGATDGDTFPTTQYRYTATDSFDGASVTVNFNITVVDSPVLAAQDDVTFTVGTAKAVTLPSVVGGVAPYAYWLTTGAVGGLPGWLTYSVMNGEDTVPLTFGSTTSTTFSASAAVPLTYSVRDSEGTEASVAFNVLAVDAPSFSGTQNDLTFTVSGDIGTINLPTASGGALPLRYAFDNNLPAGVLLNADDSILTGIPTAAQATVNYVLTATDANGANGSLPAFGIRVYPAPSFAANGFGPFTFTANAPQKSFTLPQVVDGTGAPVVAYNFGALDLFDNGGDAGVNINDFVTLGANTRTVAGSFAAALQFRAQLTATDSNNVSDTSPYATFVVVNEVTFSQSDLANIADQTYRVGANVNRILPQVTGGIAPIAYTLSDAAGDAYGNNIANVAFNANTRAFAGTVASSATGDYTLTYAGVDANGGGATTPMRVNIVAPLALPQQTDVIYYASMSGINTTLPQAANIISDVTYRLRDLSGNGLTLPNGIAFNANANPPSLTGATDGDTFPTTQYRYTAIDSFDGASVTVTFNITVSDSPVLAAQDDVTFTVGTAKAVTLPSVVGGVAPYAYWLTTGAVGGLPGWLTYSVMNGEDTVPLTFGSTTSTTFSASAAVPLTYSVRDSEGTEASVAFNVVAVDVPSFSGTQNDLTFTVSGNIGTINLPTASGGALPLRYAFDNNLPAGVSLNENDAQLTGTPTAVQATVNYVLTATDANGANGNLPAFGIRVYPAPSFAANGFGPFTFTANAPQKSFTLPQVVDGTGAPVVVYNFGALDLFNNGGDAGVNINNLVTRDSTARSVAGSFAAALQFRAQLTATDSNNVSDTSPYATFVVVNEVTFSQSDLANIADQTYRVDANVNRILPQVTGGIAPIAYTLSDAAGDAYGNNIANVAFNADTRAFAGTVASTATGDYTLTYAGVDANDGGATTPMRIKVVGALTLASPDDVVYYSAENNISTTLPQATNIVGNVTYRLRDLSGNGLTLPNGIAFNANANPPSLTGATDGDTFPTTQYRYTATDSFDGASVTVTFNITVSDSPVLAAQDDVTFTVGTAKAVTLPSVVGGVAPYAYWLTTGAAGGLPGWLTYSTSGEDAVPLTFGSTTSTTFSASAAVPLTYSVRDSEGTEASVAFNVLAVDAPSFSGTQDELTFTVSGDIGTINLPTASGGALPLRYAFDNNLPAGVLLNADDSILTGIPTAAQATVNYVLTATDANGASGSLPAFGIRVYPAPSFAASGFGPFTFTANAPQKSFTLPQVVDGTGAPVVAYNFGELDLFNNGGDAGVNINDFVTLGANTRTVAGSFAAALQFRAQLTATDSNNVSDTSPYATFVVVNEVTFSQGDLANIADQTYRVGANVNRILPQVTGGIAPIVYTLSDADGNAYGNNNNIANIAFNANTRAFAGTVASTATGDYTFTYAGKGDNGGKATTPMRINIVDALALPQPNDMIYYASMSGISTALPQAENIIGDVTYQLRDLSGNGLTLPSGIAFNANAPSLTGATGGNTFPTTQYRYTATDSFDGASVTVNFNITVIDSPVLAAQDDVTFTVGTAKAVTLPSVVGGVAPYAYWLTTGAVGGLPGWLTYSTSGEDTVPLTFGSTTSTTFSASAAVPLTYSVRDNEGTEASVAFNVLAVDAPSFSGTQDELTFTVSGDISTINLPTASGGALPLRYAFDNNLPAGVSLNENSSILTGIPTVSQATVNYVLTATDANGANGNLPAFGIRVYPAPSFAANGFGPFTFTANAPQKSFTLPQVVDGTGAPVVAYNFGALDLFNNGGDAGVAITDLVTFDSTARSVAGSFAAALQFRAQLTATDSNNVSDTSPYATFVVVNEVTFSQSDLDGIADQTYRVGANVNRILPQVTGGIAPIAYTLSDAGGDAYGNNNIANIAFNANTRAFAGTVASTATGDYTFTYAGKGDNDGKATTPMRIKVVGALTLASPDDVVYYSAENNISTALPQAANIVGDVTYQLRDLSGNGLNLPNGIAFNAGAPSLTGATDGNTFPTTKYRYTATDSFDGASVTVNFNITVIDSPVLAAQDDVTFTVGTAKAVTLPSVVGGVAPYAYWLTTGAVGGLPGWLTYSTSGEDAVPLTFGSTTSTTFSASAAVPLTYSVRDSEGTEASVAFNVLAVDAPSFSGTQDKLHATIGATIADTQLPRASGGASPLSYSLAPNLPSGLTISENLLISGAPASNATVGEANYTLTATDANGATAQLVFALEVYPPLAFVQANPSVAQTYTVGVSKMLQFSQVEGGRAPLIFALDLSGNTALSGMQFDASTRALTGTFAADTSAINLTYRATDQNGATIHYAFNITAVLAPHFVDTVGAQTYLRNRAITPLQLPVAADGATPLSYALTDSSANDFGNGAVIGGLAYANRRISGAPTAASGDYELRYRATDNNGAHDELTFVITIVDELAFAQQSDLVFAVNQPIVSELTQASGGIGALTYDIRAQHGAALSGIAVELRDATLTLLADTRATAYAATPYILRVRDMVGNTAATTFTIRVVDGVAFLQQPSDVTFTVGIAKSVTLPAAHGFGAITYTLSGAPSWLNVAPSSASTTDTFVISATPSGRQGASVLTYGATDANAQSVSVTFAVLAVRALRFTDTVADLTFTAGQTVDAITLPQAEDGALPLAYSLAPNLPLGMMWHRDARQISGTPSTPQDTTHFYTARDVNGATAVLTFSVKIYPAADVAVSNYTFTANWRSVYTLPESEVGAVPFHYWVLDEAGDSISVNGDISGNFIQRVAGARTKALTFDPQSRELLGSYALSLEKVTAENLSYRVTDANGHIVYEPFAAVIFPAPTFTADGNITFAVSTFDLDNPFAHRLPKVKTGTGAPTITYQLGAAAALPSWLSANQWMADGAQLTFAIAADPVVTVTIDRTTLDAVEAAVAQSQPLPTVTYQHMAIDANGANTTLPLRITLMPGVRAEFINDGVSRDFVDVSKVILSEAAGTLASNAIGAIANRIANARAGGFAVNGIGGQSPIFYLGGQHSLEGIIAANSKALADDTFDEKNLLSGTKFSLPFNAQGAPGDIGNGMAIWGAGEYKEMNGATGEVDWDGELRSLYFGIDGLMFANNDALGGVAIAFSKLTADYADIGADTRAGSGDYEMRLTTLYPYYSWRNDNIDWWAGAGYGEGDLKITRNADRDYSTDVFMRTMAAGANILAGIFDRTRLHIKAETIVSRLKLSQSADLAQQKIDTGLARITAEVTAAKRLPGGGRYEPSYSFGWRYDFGDSDLDASLEKTFGWRFVNAAGRLSGELRLQGAYDGHTYREWGAYALIRSEAGADGQGVSLQLRPSYGATGLDVNRLWQGGGLQTFGDAVAPDEYAMQVDARVGFGVTGVWNGLLTPFAEWSYSADGDVYRLGLDWAASEWLELRLIGEHQELEGGDIRRSVWVRGNAKF